MENHLEAASLAGQQERLQDFIDSLREHLPVIDRDLAELRNAPGNLAVIGSLFRALHTIKGDASFCNVDLAVAIVHPLESLLDRVRHNELAFSDGLAALIQLATDHLDDAVAQLVAGNDPGKLQRSTLVAGLERLVQAAPDDFARIADDVLRESSGRHVPTHLLSAMPGDDSTTREEDLRFFLALASQLETRSPLFKGRTRRLLRLASETNRAARSPIDPVQLEAAVYLHDVGMMFLPESVWLRAGDFGSAERSALRRHPVLAAGLLRRMRGWDAAAEMVAQHHEMPDGRGYPAALPSAQICPGASILAIIDAFEAMTLKHRHRGPNRSLLRAISEINACDGQFSPEWIGPFNQVIRNSVKA